MLAIDRYGPGIAFDDCVFGIGMSVRIALVDRVVGGIGIAVGADALVAHIPPVG